MYLLDLDYIIYFLQGKEKFVSVIEELEGDVFVSAISVGEIMEGLGGKRHEKKLEIFKGFLETVNVLPVDENVALEFAVIRRKLRKKGGLIGDLDTLIASTCIASDLVLVSNNRRHFSRVEGLKLYG